MKPEESSELFQARRWSWKRQHVRAIQELACINMPSNELRASIDRKSIRRERVQWKAIAHAHTHTQQARDEERETRTHARGE